MNQPRLNELHAVVLAGGRGTRLQSVVADRPKVLAPVAGRPFLQWLLMSLQGRGVARVVLSTGHRSAQVETWAEGIRDEVDLDLVCVRDPMPLGTGGALRNALSAVDSPRLLAVNGDSLLPLDLERLLERHCARAARASLTLTRVGDVARYGSVTVDGAGWITAFREKQQAVGPGLINAGIYLLEREAVAEIPAGREVSLERDVFPAWVGNGLLGVENPGPFIDIGTPESYAEADAEIDWPGIVAGAIA